MAEITRVSSKGQAVIPSEYREILGIVPDDVLQVELVGDIIVLKKLSFESLEEQLHKRAKQRESSHQAEITKVSSKGQIVIPLPVRKILKISSGDLLQVELSKDILLLKKLSLLSLKGELRGERE